MVNPTQRQLPLFVYGTLRPGGVNFHRYLEAVATRTRSGTIMARLYDYPEGGYPFILPGDELISGDLVDVSAAEWDKTLREIDRLEDYNPEFESGSWYLRRTVRVRLTHDEVVAWTYYWNRPDLPGRPIKSGDWRRRSEG